jgi:superfamily I DNA/RNA helicase
VQDAAQQAAFIAQRVAELPEEGVNLNQVAVLYRSHFHALELQLELTRRHIPFSITSGIRFFEQAHIKDATAYLKLVANPRDEVSFKRLAQLLPGIGAKGADKNLEDFFSEVEAEVTRLKLKSRSGNKFPIRTPHARRQPLPLRFKPAPNPSRQRPPSLETIRRHHFAA